LKDGPRRCCELVEITGKSHPYVWRYLKNMQNYGLTEKNGAFWNLTVLGRDFVNHLDILYNNIIEYRKKIERKKKESRKKIETSMPKASRQIPIDLWLRSSSFDDLEKEVVEVLVDHYVKTGSKFILVRGVYDLAERLKQNPSALPEALKNLRQDNVIYVYRSKLNGYWKIGLKKQFVQMLETLQP